MRYNKLKEESNPIAAGRESMTNKTIGKFEILETLGQGGYGIVYRVRGTILNVDRALKVLHPVLLADPTFIERFKREAQIMARLEHPNYYPSVNLLVWYAKRFNFLNAINLYFPYLISE